MRPILPPSAFSLPADRCWLDTANQGPLPIVAVEAIKEATLLKTEPHRLNDPELFLDVPHRLRCKLGELLQVPHDEITIGNSTSYGLSVLANALEWRQGDEILLVQGDFPACHAAWRPLVKRFGVVLRVVRPPASALGPQELDEAISSRTRLLSLSWSNSLTGSLIDTAALGEVCRRRGVLAVVNGSQVVGNRFVEAGALGIDALVACGSKWLCGPYGTGFLWTNSKCAAQMSEFQDYWMVTMTGRDLEGDVGDVGTEPLPNGIRPFDVFGTASFLNSLPWIASLGMLLDVGMGCVEAHQRSLTGYLIDALRSADITPLSPPESPSVVFESRHEDTPTLFKRLQRENFDVGFRGGAIRVSPHVFNSSEDLRALASLL